MGDAAAAAPARRVALRRCASRPCRARRAVQLQEPRTAAPRVPAAALAAPLQRHAAPDAASAPRPRRSASAATPRGAYARVRPAATRQGDAPLKTLLRRRRA